MRLIIFGNHSELYHDFKSRNPDNEYIEYNERIENLHEFSFNSTPWNSIDGVLYFIGLRPDEEFGAFDYIKDYMAKAFSTNSTGLLLAYQATKNLLKSNKPFIYMSSVAAIRPMSRNVSYCASKAASEMIIKTLARVEAVNTEKPISIFSLRLGPISDTKMCEGVNWSHNPFYGKQLTKSDVSSAIEYYLGDIAGVSSGSIIPIGEFKEK